MMPKNDVPVYVNWVWLALFAIGMGIFLIVTPKYGDDYWFSYDLAEWYRLQDIEYINGGGNVFKYGVPWHDLWSTIKWHAFNDNIRACNIIAPFLLLFPKWLGSGIAWLSLLYCVYGSLKLAKINLSRSYLVAVCVALFTLTFPWYEQMGSLIFQLNYVVAGGLCVALLQVVNNRPKGWRGWGGLILLSCIVAVWHEGFTFPLLVSFIAVICFYKRCRNPWFIITAAILLAGMGYHFYGIRISNSVETRGVGFRWSIINIFETIYYHRGVWIAFFIWLVFLFKKGTLQFFKNPLLVFLSISIITALTIAYLTGIHRSGWWADIASAIMILYMLRLLDPKSKGYKGWRCWLAGFLMLASVTELAVADLNVIKFAKEYPLIIKNYMKNPEETQFSDLNDYPWLSLPFTQFIHNRYRYSLYLANFYRQKGIDTDEMKVVPSSLRNTDAKSLRPLEGNLGFMMSGPYIVAPTDSTDRFWIEGITIDYGWFKARGRSLECIPFKSEKDGRRYVWISPSDRPTEFEIGNLKGIWSP